MTSAMASRRRMLMSFSLVVVVVLVVLAPSCVGQPVAPSFSTSGVCGYGGFNFSSLSTSDLTVSDSRSSATGPLFTYSINVCGISHNPVCTASLPNVSFCQLNSSSFSHGIDVVGSTNVSSNIPLWSFISPGTAQFGVQYSLSNGNGTGCPGSTRTAVVQFVCSPLSGGSSVSPVVEQPTCTYTVVIYTPLACLTVAVTPIMAFCFRYAAATSSPHGNFSTSYYGLLTLDSNMTNLNSEISNGVNFVTAPILSLNGTRVYYDGFGGLHTSTILGLDTSLSSPFNRLVLTDNFLALLSPEGLGLRFPSGTGGAVIPAPLAVSSPPSSEVYLSGDLFGDSFESASGYQREFTPTTQWAVLPLIAGVISSASNCPLLSPQSPVYPNGLYQSSPVRSYNFDAPPNSAALAASGAGIYGWTASDGVHAGVATFDGGSDYINMALWGDDAGLTFPTIGYSMTFEAWMKWSSFSQSWSRLMDIAAGEGNFNILVAHSANNNDVQFHCYTGGAATEAIANNVFSAGAWVHVVATLNQINPNDYTSSVASQQSVYINGVLVATLSGNLPYFTPRPYAYMGRSNWPADGLLQGSIDRFSYYNYALPTEALAVHILLSRLPIYELTFAVDPRQVIGHSSLTSPANYGWEELDPQDSDAQRELHQGILVLSSASEESVDLSQVYGSDSLPTLIPTFGGGGYYAQLANTTTNSAYSASTLASLTGLSIDVTLKLPQVNLSSGVVFDFASFPVAQLTGNNVMLSLNATTSSLQFTVVRSDVGGVSNFNVTHVQANVWYHITLVAQAINPINASWIVYINGYPMSNITGYLPLSVPRIGSYLGKPNGGSSTTLDVKFDNLRLFDYALNAAVILQLNGLSPSTGSVAVCGDGECSAGESVTCPQDCSTGPVVQLSFCLITGTAPGTGQHQTTSSIVTLATGILNTTAFSYSPTGVYTVSSVISGQLFTSYPSNNSIPLSLYPVGTFPTTYINGYITVNDNQISITAGSSFASTGNGLAFTSSSLSFDLYQNSSVNCNGGVCGLYGSLQVKLYNASAGPSSFISCQPLPTPSSSSTGMAASSVPPIAPVFNPSSIDSSCLTLSTTTATAGTTALISFTDPCALSSLTVAELELYEAAAVCRFLPSGVQSPAVLRINNSAVGVVVTSCPLPLMLSAGVYVVQLSLDGGVSVVLPVLASTSVASSTLTVTAGNAGGSSSAVVSGFTVTSLPQHPFNAAVDPLPSGFNNNDTMIINSTAVVAPANSTFNLVTLVLEVTFLQFNSTSARFAPIIVSEPALIIASSINLSQASFTWHVPNLQTVVLQRLGVPLSRLLAFSIGAYYLPSNASANSSIHPGEASGVGFYDIAGLCAPSVCNVMGAISSLAPGPLIASAFTSLAPSVLSIQGVGSSISTLLHTATVLESAADALDALSSPLATMAHANASQAVLEAQEAISLYGAQLTGGSLYSMRSTLQASLTGSPMSSAGGASVGGAGTCTSLFGDVHLLTFDGVRYDFQGVGVYWLMQTPTLLYPRYGVSGFSLQMYLQPLSSNIQPGTPAALAWASVTYMAGVALSADSLCGIIQVIPLSAPSPVTGLYFDVYDAGVYVSVAYSTAGLQASYQLSCTVLSFTAPDTAVITTYTGYTVTITALDGIARLSNLQICVPSTAYNNTEGMLGSWDNNPFDDFVDAQGHNWYATYPGNVQSTTITAGSSGPNDAAGYAAGQTWMVQPLDSFFISLGPSQVGCNITEDDSQAFSMACLLGGQRQSSNLLLYDVNVTQILATFNPATLPYVPVVWPNPVLQQQATTACQAATGGQPINSTVVQDCLADAYNSNSVTIATTPTVIVKAQQLVQTILPPTLALTTLTLSQAVFSISGLSSLTSAGGACTVLSLSPLPNTTTGVQCVYVMQLQVGTASFAALSLSTVQVTSNNGTFTLSLPSLLPGVTYSVRIALQVTVTSSQTTSTTGFSSLSILIPTVQAASLCALLYGLPGGVDYPFSSALQLQLWFNSSLITTSAGTAVQVLNGTGSRTYTNRFGVSFSTPLTLSPSAPNLLYVNSAFPVDSTGLSLLLSSLVQLPGVGPSTLFSNFSLHNTTWGAVIEGSESSVDMLGEAYLSTIPGFLNQTIAASNVNSLAALYPTCQAPVTFTNGLRPPTQPSISNGAQTFAYSYFISDGVSYSVQTNLTITATSAFANAHDQLGNPFQLVQTITGSRSYIYLPNSTSILSRVTFNASTNSTLHFYPYSLLASSPGVYTQNSVPYLDAEGLTFSVSPAVPSNGMPVGVGTQYSSVSVRMVSYNNTVSQLNELQYFNLPSQALQQQVYLL